MLHLLVSLLVAAASVLTLTAQTLVAPVVLQRVEPEYPPDFTQFVVDPARVELQVDEKGDAVALRSQTSLPDNVVRALGVWHFTPGTKDGRRANFGVFINVPIRRPLDQYLQHAARSSFEIRTPEIYAKPDAITEAVSWQPEDAARTEKNLKDDRESVTQRSQLLAYAASRADPDAAQLRFRQLSWLVRNQPQARILGTESALIAPGPAPHSADYNSVRELWLDQVTRNPNDALILAHATFFLQKPDPRKAEELLLLAVDRLGGAAAWLGETYAREALEAEHGSSAENAARARTLLAGTKDRRVLMSALDTAESAGQQLSRNGKLPADFSSFCTELLTRVKAFYPAVTQTCQIAAVPPGAPHAATITGAKLKRKVTPLYPPNARAQRIGGTVDFYAVIGKDGIIKDLELLSGPLILYHESRVAVSQWVYEPTLLNGDPVEVITSINVNFALR